MNVFTSPPCPVFASPWPARGTPSGDRSAGRCTKNSAEKTPLFSSKSLLRTHFEYLSTLSGGFVLKCSSTNGCDVTAAQSALLLGSFSSNIWRKSRHSELMDSSCGQRTESCLYEIKFKHIVLTYLLGKLLYLTLLMSLARSPEWNGVAPTHSSYRMHPTDQRSTFCKFIKNKLRWKLHVDLFSLYLVVGLPLHDLWGHVERGPLDGGQHQGLLGHVAGEAEVAELRPT